MNRPRPSWWIRLPAGVEAATLAAYLRAYAACCTGTADDMPQRAMLHAAALLDECDSSDVTCLRSIVAALDARAAPGRTDGEERDRQAWSALAHAVWRVTEAVADARGAPAPDD